MQQDLSHTYFYADWREISLRLISVASVLTSTDCAQVPKSLQLCGAAARGQGPRDPASTEGVKKHKGGGQEGEWWSTTGSERRRAGWNKQRTGKMNSRTEIKFFHSSGGSVQRSRMKVTA